MGSRNAKAYWWTSVVLFALATHFTCSPAGASEIEMQTRPPVVFANSTASDYQSDWNAALLANPTPPSGYCDTSLTAFHDASNHAQLGSLQNCGAASAGNISFHFQVQLTVSRFLSGVWNFRIGDDFGYGGAVFLDGGAVNFKPFNLDGSPGTIFFESLNLSGGAHVIDVYGQENCCDGFHDGDYLLFGSYQPLSVTDFFSASFVDALDASLSASFETNVDVANAAHELTNKTLQAALQVSEQYSCARHSSANSLSLCWYGYLSTSIDADGDRPSGSTGAMAETQNGWKFSAGVDLANYSSGSQYLGSNANDDMVGGSASIAFAPLTGLRARAVATLARHNVDAARDYVVFAPERSAGSTSGWSNGVLGSIGWGFVTAQGATIAPFASFTITNATLDAYSESGGLLPTHFRRLSWNDQVGRIGAEAEFAASDSLTVFGKGSLAHRFGSKDVALTGQIDSFDSFALPLPTQEENWVEGSAGLGWNITDAVQINGSVAATSDQSAGETVIGNIGFSVRL